MPEQKKRRSTSKRKQRLPVETASVRDTLKLLLFVQLVLFCGAGAIPNPFRLLAFLPAVSVAGAGLFWSSAYLMAALRRLRERQAAPTMTPAPAAPTANSSRKRVVRITKIA